MPRSGRYEKCQRDSDGSERAENMEQTELAAGEGKAERGGIAHPVEARLATATGGMEAAAADRIAAAGSQGAAREA